MKKFLVFLCVICIVASMGTTAFATHNYDDEGEPNDSMSSAAGFYKLKDYFDTWHIYGIASQNDKEDWFEIRPEIQGKSDFDLYPNDRRINYDLYLYDSNGDIITSSTKGTGETERIDYVYIEANQVYYLKVKYVSGGVADEPYRLRIDID